MCVCVSRHKIIQTSWGAQWDPPGPKFLYVGVWQHEKSVSVVSTDSQNAMEDPFQKRQMDWKVEFLLKIDQVWSDFGLNARLRILMLSAFERPKTEHIRQKWMLCLRQVTAKRTLPGIRNDGSLPAWWMLCNALYAGRVHVSPSLTLHMHIYISVYIYIHIICVYIIIYPQAGGAAQKFLS